MITTTRRRELIELQRELRRAQLRAQLQLARLKGQPVQSRSPKRRPSDEA